MISVVVPVYNMEKYLSRCLESLLSQTIGDMEILLIDDGSMDSSSNICKSYVQRDSRVKYFYKENGGLSDARNTAIELAKGEYITFVDSDDYVHSTYLEYLLSLIEKYEADVAACVHFETTDDKCEFDLNETRELCMSGREACERTLTDLAAIMTAACGKLYKTSIVKKYKFPYGKLHEDVATTFKYYLDSKKVVYGYRQLYAYYQHPASIMHSVNEKKIENELWAMSERALYLQGEGEKQLAWISWEFMANYLKHDVMNQIGSKKIWKKYGKLHAKNNPRIKSKLKTYLLTHFPNIGRKFMERRLEKKVNNSN